MKKNIMNLIDKLLTSSESKVALKALEKLFNSGIPFNLLHKFQFIELSHDRTILKLPGIRKNKNHLGGIHACATATLGEYPAGLSLVKHVGVSKYRFIMKKLEADYFKQSKSAVTGEVEIDHKELDRVRKELSESDKSEIIIVTNIKNLDEEVIAVIQTTWQLKHWDKVLYK